MKEAFPKHRSWRVKDPLHANVRGFQIAGMNARPNSSGSLPLLLRRCVMDDAGRLTGDDPDAVRADREDDPRLYDDLIRFKKGTPSASAACAYWRM